MTQEQLRADVAALRLLVPSHDGGYPHISADRRSALGRILAIVEPLAELSDEQVANLRSRCFCADTPAWRALARMLGGGR